MATLSRTNLKSIAERAGVSLSTISGVLNGLGRQYRISARAEKTVLEISRALILFSPLPSWGPAAAQNPYSGIDYSGYFPGLF